jgi:hypothetical protein
MTAQPTTNGGPPSGDTPGRVPAAIAPVGDPPPATAATITLVQRRATDIVRGDVIALPDDVFHPVPARVDGCRTWMWRAKPGRLLTNPHRWRLVCQTDHLDADEAGICVTLTRCLADVSTENTVRERNERIWHRCRPDRSAPQPGIGQE